MSRSSIFKSAEHFDARLSPVGREQCIDAAKCMPRPLGRVLRGVYLESRKLHEEVLEGDCERRQREHCNEREDRRPGNAGCWPKNRKEFEGGFLQRAFLSEEEKAGVPSHTRHLHTLPDHVIVLASTLRRSLETAHLVLSHALQLVRNEEVQADEDFAKVARSDSIRPSAEDGIDARSRGKRSFPESPRGQNGRSSTGCEGSPRRAVGAADEESRSATAESFLKSKNCLRQKHRGSPTSGQHGCDVLEKNEDRSADRAVWTNSNAGEPAKDGEETEGGCLVGLPVHALESMREWSGGGHICDGRVR